MADETTPELKKEEPKECLGCQGLRADIVKLRGDLQAALDTLNRKPGLFKPGVLKK